MGTLSLVGFYSPRGKKKTPSIRSWQKLELICGDFQAPVLGVGSLIEKWD